MSDTTYAISSVGPGDRYMQAEVDALLEREGIHRDQHLDYTAAMLDETIMSSRPAACSETPSAVWR